MNYVKNLGKQLVFTAKDGETKTAFRHYRFKGAWTTDEKFLKGYCKRNNMTFGALVSSEVIYEVVGDYTSMKVGYKRLLKVFMDEVKDLKLHCFLNNKHCFEKLHGDDGYSFWLCGENDSISFNPSDFVLVGGKENSDLRLTETARNAIRYFLRNENARN